MWLMSSVRPMPCGPLCYLNLATWFSRAPYNPMTGTSRWNEACVPVYTTGTTIETGGGPRESLQTVYGRIDEDIDMAIDLLEKGLDSSLANDNKSHINLYVALGIKSRACLVEGDWEGAYKAAMRVINEGSYAIGTESDLMSSMNALDKQNVMWGAGIQTADQSGIYAGFFTHMDNQQGAYAESLRRNSSTASSKPDQFDGYPPQLVGSQRQGVALYREEVFVQQPGLLSGRLSLHAGRGDVLHGCRGSSPPRRRTRGSSVDEPRHGRTRPAVQRRELQRHDARKHDDLTWTGSLLENILTQRRIELWGEYGRLFDVRRLGQGIDRRSEDGFSEEAFDDEPPGCGPDPSGYVRLGDDHPAGTRSMPIRTSTKRIRIRDHSQYNFR